MSSTTRWSPQTRLAIGAIAAPVFLVVSFAQMPFNEGFDLTEHPFSHLSIGSTGGLQRLNFVVLGLLTIVAATGLAAVLDGRTRRTASVLLALTGLGQVIAGLFTPDPSNGFPIGAPDGMPEHVSAHSNLHGLGFAVSMLSWISLLVVLARWLARHGRTDWARANVGFAVALVVTAVCLTTPVGTVLLYVVLTSTWLYTSALLWMLARRSRSVVGVASRSASPVLPADADATTASIGSRRDPR